MAWHAQDIRQDFAKHVVQVGDWLMAWEQRQDTTNRYYYRSQRLPDGRIVKIYCGGGERGTRAADADRQRRDEKSRELLRHQALLKHIQYVATPLVDLCKAGDVITEAAPLAAGYHNPRGEWRKKRHGRPFKCCNTD